MAFLQETMKSTKKKVVNRLEKKYQFFISSIYEDLKEECNKAIQAILTMNQFPIGMEMFSAADDDQWKIIKEAIDSSDFIFLLSEIDMAQSKKQPELVTQKRNLIMQLKEKFLYWHSS